VVEEQGLLNKLKLNKQSRTMKAMEHNELPLPALLVLVLRRHYIIKLQKMTKSLKSYIAATQSMFKRENLYYFILFLVGAYVGIDKYGVSSTFQVVAVLFCVVQAVSNLVIMYEMIRSKQFNKPLHINNKKILILLLTWGAIIALYFAVLTPYFQKVVLYIVPFIALLLFIVSYLRSAFKR
jgi:hypothetical protein